MIPTTDIPNIELTSDPQMTWGADRVPAGCPACKQVFLVTQAGQGMRCPHCLGSQLTPQPAWLRKESPELAVPFTLQRQGLEQVLEGFTRNIWLHSDDFTPHSLASRAVPMLWPMWLVDAGLRGDWQMEAGYVYQVKSSQESYAAGGWRTQERIESRLRWEPRLGTLDRHYENLASPAVSDHAQLTGQVGAYRLEKAQAYASSQNQQVVIRVPDVHPDAAWPLARQAVHRAAEQDCQKACAADQTRQFSIHPEYRNLHWTQMLLPVYVSYYTDDEGHPQRVLINGQTGQVGGLRLASQKKGWRLAGILAGVAVLVFLMGVLGLALTPVLPPAAALGGFLVVVGLLVGVVALVPAVWPWQWNRGQPRASIPG
jgi:hypothetical protein